MTKRQECDGCEPVDSCEDMAEFGDLTKFKIKKAVAPVKPWTINPFGKDKCPEPDDVQSGCIGFTAKNCSSFGQTLADCLAGCDKADDIEAVCGVFKRLGNRPMYELCKHAFEGGQELCRDFCRTQKVGVAKDDWTKKH